VSCCDVNGLNSFFRGALVRWERLLFERRGPTEQQQRIIELASVGPSGRSVLEVGCGVGAVTTTLLARGAARGLYVDLSQDYLQAAAELAQRAGVGGRAAFYRLDFAEARLAMADIVIADRVVCCYPDAETLLEAAAAHSRALLIFSYPRPSWLSRLLRRLLNLMVRLLGKDYRFFLHDPERLLRAATRSGHRLSRQRSLGFWQLAVLERD
jgi:magnesium-protoporphyrin O-methyltransferase